jgi:transcriptional regulator with XRE-family HTH domain
MAKKIAPNARVVETLDEVRRQAFEARPSLRRLWDANHSRRSIVLALVRLRKQANLTQKELAEKAGWDTGYVSRLESASGGIPDLGTITRYATACDRSVGLMFGTVSPAGIHIEDAVTLSSSQPVSAGFEQMRHMDVA